MSLMRLTRLFNKPSVYRNFTRYISADKLRSGEGIKPIAHERLFLVYYGKYKSLAEIPEYIPFEVHTKLRNQIRISIANYAMIVTFLASLVMMFTGKRAAERGESVQQMNMDWHKEMDEVYNKTKQT